MGEGVEGDVVAEGKGQSLVIKETDGIGHGVAVGRDMPTFNLHLIKEMIVAGEMIIVKQIDIYA